MTKIYAKDPRYTGLSGVTQFVNGVAEVPDTATGVINLYKGLGFKIEHETPPVPAVMPAAVMESPETPTAKPPAARAVRKPKAKT